MPMCDRGITGTGQQTGGEAVGTGTADSELLAGISTVLPKQTTVLSLAERELCLCRAD